MTIMPIMPIYGSQFVPMSRQGALNSTVPFGQSDSNNIIPVQSQYKPEDHSLRNALLIGCSVIAAATAAYFMLRKGNAKGAEEAGKKATENIGNGVKETVERAAATGGKKVETVAMKEKLNNIGQKYGLKFNADKYCLESAIIRDENGLAYLDGKLFTGRTLCTYKVDGNEYAEISKFVNGKSVSTSHNFKPNGEIHSYLKNTSWDWQAKDKKLNILHRFDTLGAFGPWESNVCRDMKLVKSLYKNGYKEKASKTSQKVLNGMLEQLIKTIEKPEDIYMRGDLLALINSINKELPGLQKLSSDNPLVVKAVKYFKSAGGRPLKEVVAELRLMQDEVVKEMGKATV